MQKANNFDPFPVRTLRASNKTWKRFIAVKGKKNLTWDKLINDLLDKRELTK